MHVVSNRDSANMVLMDSNTIAEHTSEQASKKLKLLSYNVQIGIPTKRYRQYITNSWRHVLPFPERQNNLDRIADFVRDFDIVGLLELDAGSIRSDFIHQPNYIAERAELPHVYTRTNRDIGVFAKHSFAIMSRYPASQVIEHTLPSRIPGRGALEVHFGEAHDSLVVVLAHLSLSKKARARQLAYLSDVVKPHRHAVVMGDFNAHVDSKEFSSFFSNTGFGKPREAQATFPSWKPRHSLDHILTSEGVQQSEHEVFGVDYSDHLPVGIDIDIPNSALNTPLAVA